MSNQEETLLEPTEEIEENSEIEDEESIVDDLDIDLEMPDDEMKTIYDGYGWTLKFGARD